MSFRKLIATGLFFVLSIATAQAQGVFSHKGVAADGARYEKWLVANWPKAAGRAEGNRMRAAAWQTFRQGKDPRQASRQFIVAVRANPNDADAWIGLARALLAIKPSERRRSERYSLPVNASGSAYIAYQRAKRRATKARALAVLASALERRSYWRPAIEALKASLKFNKVASVEQRYFTLRAQRGFRILNYKVESDLKEPRLCVVFSELLQKGGEFASFVSVNGKDPQGVRAEGRRLCIEGFEHGKRYNVLVRAGLPSDIDEPLTKQSELGIYVRDRTPSVRFTGRAYVLPSRGQKGIPVVSVNTDKVAVSVFRINDRSLTTAVLNGDLSRQLSDYAIQQLANQRGLKVYSGVLQVKSRLNEDVTTAVPVGDAVKVMQPGVYALIARAKDKARHNAAATQWFIVSDLGLTAFSGDAVVYGFVRSLSTASPVANVTVRLIARNNEVLAIKKTDAKGFVRFSGQLSKTGGGQAPAIMAAKTSAGDYAFLDLTNSAFDLTDRGVKGRNAPGPIDGFLYAERGVYRPGDSVFLTGLARSRAGYAVKVPLTLVVRRPDGVEHRRLVLNDQGLGGRSHKLQLATGAMTGTWRTALYVDPKDQPIAELAFLVEDFVPERLDMTLAAESKVLAPNKTGTISLKGRYLYGPPAAGLSIEGDIVVSASKRDLGGYKGYHFGLAETRIAPVRDVLSGLPKTDAGGAARINVGLPEIPRTQKPLEARILVRLREAGGRSIERTINLPVTSEIARIGIRPEFSGSAIGDGQLAKFRIIHLTEKGRIAAGKKLKWTLHRLDRSWQWYKRDGSWSYDAITIARKEASGTLTTRGSSPSEILVKPGYGRYRLMVTSTDPGGPASSVVFTAGWYAGDKADTPEVLDIALDKKSYVAGDTAYVRIATRMGGKARIAVVSDTLKLQKEVTVPKGGGQYKIKVGSEWGAGAYVVATLYRPLNEKLKRMPSRAIGVHWLGLNQSSRTLKVGLTMPERIKSGGDLTVPVTITGLKAGEEARVTVAAVDVGILNVTRYVAPKPEKHFYAQTRLSTEIRDLYGRLIDGMRAERGKLSVGGDGGGGSGVKGRPPSEEPVALYSGIVKVGADGKSKVSFQLPEFNGTVRVMAVAWSNDKLGHGTADVIVRDPVALTISAPRFLTLGDSARLLLATHNVEGPDAKYRVTLRRMVDANQAVVLFNKSVALKRNQLERVAVYLKPSTVGAHRYRINISGPNDIDVQRVLSLKVNPPAGDIRRITVANLKAGTGTLVLSKDLLAGLIPDMTRVNVSVGPTAKMDVPGLLSQLDRYPYGCAEQTVSRALPLVYANQLSKATGLGIDKALKGRVQKAIDRVFAMQDSSGAFGAWGPSYTNLWLTSYVMDFLTRAKEAGYRVNPRGFQSGLDRLQNFVSYAQDFKRGGEKRAYALYVLARNGRAPIGELRYYVDTRLGRFATPLAQAQLGAALAMMGDQVRAERAFTAAIAQINGNDEARRTDYGSRLRDGAAVVTLVSETRVLSSNVPRLTDVITKAFQARQYTSTQEQAWMLLAAKAVSDEASQARLTIDNQSIKGWLTRRFSPARLLSRPVEIVNKADRPVNALVSVIGASLRPEPAVARGITIERTYYSLDGKKADLASIKGGSARIKQTDRFVVVLKVRTKDIRGRILLVDRLPAGLEIENPRLISSGDLGQLSWVKSQVAPEHSEFRDDRFVAAFDLYRMSRRRNAKEAVITAAYMVRAVTPGTFVHPAATVEDMYRPDRHARTLSGNLTVSPLE